MRVRRPGTDRSALAVASRADALPGYLAAGRCLEVWAPGMDWGWDGGAGTWGMAAAMHRWSDARDRWLDEHGYDRRDRSRWPRLLHDHSPWSFARKAAAGPGQIAQTLLFRGLEPDWTPDVALAELRRDFPDA